jgi:hypothetical protein
MSLGQKLICYIQFWDFPSFFTFLMACSKIEFTTISLFQAIPIIGHTCVDVNVVFI